MAQSTDSAAYPGALTGEAAQVAARLVSESDELEAKGEFAAALAKAEELLALRTANQGEAHWETFDAGDTVARLRKLSEGGREAAQAWRDFLQLLVQGQSLQKQGRYPEATRTFEKALKLCLKLLGDDFVITAAVRVHVGIGLQHQGKLAEAEPYFQQSLEKTRLLAGENHPQTAAFRMALASLLSAQARFAEATPEMQAAIESLTRAKGERNAETLAAMNNFASNLQRLGAHADAQPILEKVLKLREETLGEHADTASSYNNLALNFNQLGKPLDALPLYEKSLAMRRRVLGERHPDTGQSYSNLGSTLHRLAKYEEAQTYYDKGLAIRLAALGPNHPNTASSHYNIGNNLRALGRYDEAVEHYRDSLNTYLQVYGEKHYDTATSHYGLGIGLLELARYEEAQEHLQQALATRVALLGEWHPETALSYNALSELLQRRGKYAEALPLAERALAIHRQIYGDNHPITAKLYQNLGVRLTAQGRTAEAEELMRKCLQIRANLSASDDDETAAVQLGLAQNLHTQKRFDEAEATARSALDTFLSIKGADHPDTGEFYNTLGLIQEATKKYDEAAANLEAAIAKREKNLPAGHPQLALSYSNAASCAQHRGEFKTACDFAERAVNILAESVGRDHDHFAAAQGNLAAILYAQGSYPKAWLAMQEAERAFLAARSLAAFGGENRAVWMGESGPLASVAACAARLGHFDEAWRSLENHLGRGLWDDLFLRAPGVLTLPEQESLAKLTSALARYDQVLSSDLPPARREQALEDRQQASLDLGELQTTLLKKYGPLVGENYDISRIQAALPEDAALIAWIDLQALPHAADSDGDHWAVVVRKSGAPRWTALPGSGPDGAWTEADQELSQKLREALSDATRDDWAPLAAALREQRLTPISEGLQATADGLPPVRQLVVLPSASLIEIPIDVLQEEGDAWSVTYAPSGTMFAWLQQRERTPAKSVVIVGDPVFRDNALLATDDPLPPHGLLVKQVVENSNAASAAIAVGDVLLSYDESLLNTFEDLKLVAAGERKIPIEIWRNGKILRAVLSPGRLGVAFDLRPAPAAIASDREFERLMLASRSGKMIWKQLPASAWEAASLAKRFETSGRSVRTLLGRDASEEKLYELAAIGELADSHILHLATHGRIDASHPRRSSIIVSQVDLPDPVEQMAKQLPPFDGEIAVEEIVADWKLNASVVTLSACETALGKEAAGEGFVGFTQALLTAGADSLCLSLWEVSDLATALLMDRFYGNLLGQTEGLAGPLPKSEALAEAQRWLRDLKAGEIDDMIAGLRSVPRGPGHKSKIVEMSELSKFDRDARPFAHPYYWSAFVLVGKRD